MTSGRAFTEEELAALGRSALERMELAVGAADPRGIRSTYEAIEAAFRANLKSFEAMERQTVAILDGMGLRGPGADTERSWTIAAHHGVDLDLLARLGADHGPELERLAIEGADVLAAYRSIEDAYVRVHDAHIDWIASLWSVAYRSGGPDALEAVLRELADRSLMRWMPHDLAADPRERLVQWTTVMMANFASISVVEDDDRFAITQDPCGTCSRRIEAGAYGPPLDLAVVAEAHPTTWGAGGVPVYRTHVAVMHWVVPIERQGRPWPRISCPSGMGTGPCVVELWKDPGTAPAEVPAWLAERALAE